MSDPVWPASLPVPLYNGYSLQDEPPLRRIQMESGPDRIRRISTSFLSKPNFDLYLAQDQADTLRDFYDTDINAGSYWFSMPLNTGGGVANHRSRIVGGLRWRPIDQDHWIVSFNLETEDRIVV